MRLCLGRRGGGSGKVFLVLTLRLTILLYFWMAINEINFPQVESALPVMVISKRSPCPCLDPQAFSSHFLPLPC